MITVIIHMRCVLINVKLLVLRVSIIAVVMTYIMLHVYECIIIHVHDIYTLHIGEIELMRFVIYINICTSCYISCIY